MPALGFGQAVVVEVEANLSHLSMIGLAKNITYVPQSVTSSGIATDPSGYVWVGNEISTNVMKLAP